MCKVFVLRYNVAIANFRTIQIQNKPRFCILMLNAKRVVIIFVTY